MIVAEWGGQSIVSEKIYNWLGSVSIPGAELAENFKKHVLANTNDSLQIKDEAKVSDVGILQGRSPTSKFNIFIAYYEISYVFRATVCR